MRMLFWKLRSTSFKPGNQKTRNSEIVEVWPSLNTGSGATDGVLAQVFLSTSVPSLVGRAEDP